MDLLAVHIASGEVLAENSPALPIMGGRKYRTFVDAIGLEGIPCSAYFAAILLDKNGSEITRKIRWLNDLSGNVVRYPLVFRTPPNATNVILAYRINQEDAVPGSPALPFARVVCHYGAPIEVPSDADQGMDEALRRRLDEQLEA